MGGMTKDRINELRGHITLVMLTTHAAEPRALFDELGAFDRREQNWNKASRVAGGVIGVVVYFGTGYVIDLQPDRWFRDADVILGFVFAFVAFSVAMIGIMELGKVVMRPQIIDWARRADRFVREDRVAASTSAGKEPILPPPHPKPKPAPLSPVQKVLWISAGILGLILLSVGLYSKTSQLVGAGATVIAISALYLFYRPDR